MSVLKFWAFCHKITVVGTHRSGTDRQGTQTSGFVMLRLSANNKQQVPNYVQVTYSCTVARR
jgi:hypothetical protein